MPSIRPLRFFRSTTTISITPPLATIPNRKIWPKNCGYRNWKILVQTVFWPRQRGLSLIVSTCLLYIKCSLPVARPDCLRGYPIVVRPIKKPVINPAPRQNNNGPMPWYIWLVVTAAGIFWPMKLRAKHCLHLPTSINSTVIGSLQVKHLVLNHQKRCLKALKCPRPKNIILSSWISLSNC